VEQEFVFKLTGVPYLAAQKGRTGTLTLFETSATWRLD
jgi:hypothetical protein